ncbi:hypothetical protein DFP72DRAFT_1146193 [Ephemerocybe angulata]|uniref:FAD-binding PCMH-type domain-containing protein n=1 Tax=Ephemerocybe angulata TaxID=980116 RepID=A0A8H6M017_9AGAR|nr:hypothetical protein DFP72DRAFT_1146193 [Tulosesus angulatus]
MLPFDAAKCVEIQTNWGDKQWNNDRPISNLWTFWTNNTCHPFPESSQSSSCARGFYGDYVVPAKTREHIKYTIDFARQNKLPLIRNTGHDFIGRTTCWGSIILNTHVFKDVTFVKKYTGPGTWRGGAATVGAGIQGRELPRLANKQRPPQVVVAGECPTVGFASGYILGGGCGPLASLYGMAADQVLSFEVVTASGKTFHLCCDSLTVKTYNDLPSSAVIFNVNFTHTIDFELYWKGVDAFHFLSNRYVENGLVVHYELSPLRLHVQAFLNPKRPLRSSMTNQPTNRREAPVRQLDAGGIPYSRETKQFQTFFDLYVDDFEDEGSGASALTGGWIYTRKDIAQNATAINAAQRLTAE